MIRLEDVSKSFHSGRREVRALKGISYVFEDRTMTVVSGKSGSGKTTLLNLIAGLEQPDAGSIWWKTERIDTLSSRELSLFLRRQVGFVFQRGNLLSGLTVEQNLAFPLVLNGASPDGIRSRVHDLLERVGLAGANRAFPHELSGGEVQRVAVARAVSHAPAILLSDEPTANLDTATGLEILDLLREVGGSEKCTVVVCTHDPEIIKRAGRMVQLKDGRMVAEAAADPIGGQGRRG